MLVHRFHAKVWSLLGATVLALLFLLLYVGLRQDPHEVPGQLLGQKAPALSVKTGRASAALASVTKNRVWLLHFWSTWCESCVTGHATWAHWLHHRQVPMIAMAYRDAPDGVRLWLKRHGNPYVLNLFDPHGEQAIAWGVYGVPETFLIDKAGIVRGKYTGPASPKLLASIDKAVEYWQNKGLRHA